MNHQQRFAEASAHYKAALQTVAKTPPPLGQKFEPGARVKIADDLGYHMRHFPAGKLATVEHTYAHAYGRHNRALQLYSLNIDGYGSVCWYNEEQLERA